MSARPHRDLKTSRVMASNGLVFCVSSGGGTSKQLLRLVDSSRLLVCRLLYGDGKKIKTFLLKLI